MLKHAVNGLILVKKCKMERFTALFYDLFVRPKTGPSNRSVRYLTLAINVLILSVQVW